MKAINKKSNIAKWVIILCVLFIVIFMGGLLIQQLSANDVYRMTSMLFYPNRALELNDFETFHGGMAFSDVITQLGLPDGQYQGGANRPYYELADGSFVWISHQRQNDSGDSGAAASTKGNGPFGGLIITQLAWSASASSTHNVFRGVAAATFFSGPIGPDCYSFGVPENRWRFSYAIVDNCIAHEALHLTLLEDAAQNCSITIRMISSEPTGITGSIAAAWESILGERNINDYKERPINVGQYPAQLYTYRDTENGNDFDLNCAIWLADGKVFACIAMMDAQHKIEVKELFDSIMKTFKLY